MFLTFATFRAVWRTRTRPGAGRPWCSARCTSETGSRGSGMSCQPDVTVKWMISLFIILITKSEYSPYLFEALQAAVGWLGIGAHHGRLLYEYQLQRIDISGGYHESEKGKKSTRWKKPTYNKWIFFVDFISTGCQPIPLKFAFMFTVIVDSL